MEFYVDKIESLSKRELEEQLPTIMADYLQRLDNAAFIQSLQEIEGDTFFQISLARHLTFTRISKYGMNSPRYGEILNQMLQGLKLYDGQSITDSLTAYKDSVQQHYKPFMEQHEYMLENYLVNYVFKNLFPYDYKSFFESFQMLVTQFTLIKIHTIGVAASLEELTPEIVIKCVQQLAKTMEHNGSYIETVHQHLVQSGYTTMGHMFSLIKS